MNELCGLHIFIVQLYNTGKLITKEKTTSAGT